MSAVDISAKASRRRRSLRELLGYDWVFVFFCWLTMAWLLFNILELFNSHRFMKFDIMPFAAGVLVVTFGWWALRLGERIDRAVDGLDQGASLELKGHVGVDEFQTFFRGRVKRWSVGFGIFITLFMVAGFAAFVFQQRTLEAGGRFFDGLLGSVMIGAGYIIGSLLGRLIGYGLLLGSMEKRGVHIVSLATSEATTALRGLEGVYGYAVAISIGLCFWSAVWWTIWEFGCDPYRDDWEPFTLGIWFIAFVLLFLTGWIPIRAFQRRLDSIYGGPAAREALDQQLKEAEEDHRKLKAALDGRATSAEIQELEGFIKGIQRRRFRSPLLSQGVLLGLILGIILLFALPLAWSLATTGVVLNGSQYRDVKIDEVVPDGPAAAAGFSKGDSVVGVDGQPVSDIMAIQQIIARSAGRLLSFRVKRGCYRIELQAIPQTFVPANAEGKTIGVLGLRHSTRSGWTIASAIDAMTGALGLQHNSRR